MKANSYVMKTILFDLDGTLVNHFTAITHSINYAERALGSPQSSYETVLATVGGGIRLTLTRLLGEQKAKEAYPHFMQHFDANLLDGVFALLGAQWLLQQLKSAGKQTAIFTNKGGAHSRRIADHLELSPYLDANLGTGDTPFRKPEPEFSSHILDQLKSTPEETIMIGDSPFDFQAAKSVGMRAYLVTTGSHSAEQLREETNADGIYPDLIALAADLFDLSPEPQLA